MDMWTIIKVDECLSTNSFMKQKKLEGKLDDKTAILSEFQTSGRGQGSNNWHSEKGKNVLISLFREFGMSVENHFLLTIIVSLALHETLSDFGVHSSIKWPNDIYVANKKIAGILIENSLMNSLINDTIIGIGLNVSQTKFPETIPNPVSLAQLLKKNVDKESVVKKIVEKIDAKFEMALQGEGEMLFHAYTEHLYRYKKWLVYEERDGHNFTGQIRGVMPDGRLIIETEGGELKHFLFGEVKYVL